MNAVELIKNAVNNNPVYSLFDKEDVHKLLLNLKIVKTLWKDSIESERSLRLASKDPKQSEDLIAAFNLNPLTFPKKFQEAINGDGQEYKRIRTLHSSSLISLLCFYDISETKPLIFSIRGNRIKFFESHFEKKNTIGNDETGKPHESNIDVFLKGRDMTTGKDVVLFLESKFSEYLSWGKHGMISNHVYGETYSQLFAGGYLDRMGLRYGPADEMQQYSELASIKGKTRHYASGFKQMVSHFLGVKSVADSGVYNNFDIYLGEILYRFPESIDPNLNKFSDYTKLYGILAEGLNAISESKLKIVDRCLTYQEVFKSYDLDDAVRTFYLL